MIGIGTGLIGYWKTKLNIFIRIINVLAGLLLIIPGLTTDLIGIGSLAIVYLYQYFKEKSLIKEQHRFM